MLGSKVFLIGLMYKIFIEVNQRQRFWKTVGP